MVENKWNFENDRGSDFTNETVVELIKPFYRQVNKEDINLIHHGTYNVFEIDDYIFRIPDKTLYNDKGYQLIHDEIKKLQFLRSRLTYLIPEPIFISEDPLKPLVGYRKIPGVSIEKIWAEIPEHNKLLLAKEIGLFLTEFHSVYLMQEYLKVFKVEPLNQNSIKKNFLKIYKDTKEKIFPIIETHEKKFLQDIFASYFAEFESGSLTCCLTHQDFDMSNILIDPHTYNITGIIDFEDTSIGDPAYDLIFISQGKNFFETILNNYSGLKDDFLIKRIQFYYLRTPIPYLLYGIEHNLPDMISYGKHLLKKSINITF